MSNKGNEELRKPSLAEAKEFCLKLIKNNRPLCITRDKESGGLKVTLFNAEQHIDVIALRASIMNDHPKVKLELSPIANALCFTAPYSLDDIYRLVYSAIKEQR